MKHLFFSFILILSVVCHAQGQTKVEFKNAGVLAQSAVSQPKPVSVHISDAETGESLPYVSVTTSAGKGTLSNADGDFNIEAAKDDVVQISMVGYVKQEIRFSDLPSVIQMKPVVRTLTDIVVSPIDADAILAQVINRLKVDYKRGKDKEGVYFLRVLLNDKIHSNLMESFFQASSVVNIRKPSLLSGQQGMDLLGEQSGMMLYFSNIHKHAGIGAMTFKSPFWKDVIKPLQSLNETKKYYHVSVDKIVGDGNDAPFYKVQFEWKGKMPIRLHDTRYMTGTMYVDAGTLRPLRFEGLVNNMYQQVNLMRMPSKMRFHVGYDMIDGFTHVSNISIQGGNDMMHYRTLIYRVDDDGLSEMAKRKATDNLVSSIYDVGYDSILWSRNNIVARTRDEELAAFGSTTISHPIDNDSVEYVTEPQDSFLHLILKNLKENGTLYPQEKVYVHMDNTCYFLGDTIWFAAYTRQTDKALPSKLSGVLYVELLNEDGYLIDRKMVNVHGGYGNGFFILDEKARYAGFYELRAYTRWQLNWGLFEKKHSRAASNWFLNRQLESNYYRNYEKLYSRVFPVYDRPSASDEQLFEMTPRPHFREYKKRDRNLVVTIYPEGGNLVQGVENGVAFEAKWSDGEYAKGMLHINGDSVPVTHRGRGDFSFIPNRDAKLRIRFREETGEWIDVKCPQIISDGVALHVKQTNNLWHLSVNQTSLLPERKLALSIIHEGVVIAFKPLNDKTSDFRFHFDKPGVYQATVFDGEGHVYADRLFFSQTGDLRQPSLGVSLENDIKPNGRVEMKVKADSRCSNLLQNRFSLSVHDSDANRPSWDNGNIMTEMLLSSEIRGFVPSPEWYFEDDDEEHRHALDLLMMTQGWRRYDWHQYALRKDWSFTQPCEAKQPILQGHIFNTGELDPRLQAIRKEKAILHPDTLEMMPDGTYNMPVKKDGYVKDFSDRIADESLLHSKLVSVDGVLESNCQKTKDGAFSLPIPCYYGSCYLFLAATPVSRELASAPHEWKEMFDPEYLKFKELRKKEISPSSRQVLIDYHYPRFASPYDFYQNHLPEMAVQYSDSILSSEERLRTVEISKHKRGLSPFNDRFPVMILDAMNAENDIIDAGMYQTEEMMIRTYFGDMGQDRISTLIDPDIAESGRDSLTNVMSERIYHRYGIPNDSLLQSKPLTYDILSPGDKRKLLGLGVFQKHAIYSDFAPRNAELNIYNSQYRPEVYVADYPYESGQQHPVYCDRCVLLPGFSYPAEFYHPDYSKHPLPEGQHDYRRTLYWNPNLQLDENGEATITFYNNSRTTRLSIEAEGQASDGTLLWGRRK